MTLPSLITNPGSDRELRELAETLVRDGVTTPADLAARLRDRYPRVVVRQRELSNEQLVVWYVYREGLWMPSKTS